VLHPPTSVLRSRQTRRPSSSCGVGALAMEHTLGSPRLKAIRVRTRVTLAAPVLSSILVNGCSHQRIAGSIDLLKRRCDRDRVIGRSISISPHRVRRTARGAFCGLNKPQ
jgi:hypothetical protein